MRVLGVDIGGTKIAAGVVDSETGAVLYSERTPTNAQEGGPAILARALAHAKHVIASANVAIDAVGIGAGGQIDYRTGVVLSATDILPGWAGTRLAEAFAEAFHVPAFADNDVNAFALGEHRFGAGRGATDAVFIALGTGVGGAIVTNGKLHRGKRGTGGELGHLMFGAVEGDGYYTFEDATNGKALAQTYQFSKLLRQSPGSLCEPITGVSVGEAALRGDDSAASTAVRIVGTNLGIGLASLANILDTERFVIGGGLADLGELLLEPARKVFGENTLPIFRDTPIVAAKLGTNSSVVGAACVALVGIAGAEAGMPYIERFEGDAVD
ncbi:MAG: ROK family protein [Akkermansiaceae bacterium]|nr:ROK family protein [Armatimonadota bacterium]